MLSDGCRRPTALRMERVLKLKVRWR